MNPPSLQSAPTLETPTAAHLEADRNRSANLFALAATQPDLAGQLLSLRNDADWTYARDGALTLRSGDKWWADCSVPRAAGLAMLKTLVVHGNVACYLEPHHPAHVQIVLEKLRADQAIVVVCPGSEWIGVAMGCGNFSADIYNGRLWFAAGDAWEAQLHQIFEQNIGLPTPQVFVRTTTLAEERAAELVPAAQKIFTQIGESRSAAAIWSAQAWMGHRPARKFCVVARSAFRLWDDDGKTLEDVLLAGLAVGDSASTRTTNEAGGCDTRHDKPHAGDKRTSITANPPDAANHPTTPPAPLIEVTRIDPDNPRQAGSALLAKIAGEYDALILINAGRRDLPVAVADQIPVITWLTTPRIPAFAGAQHDALMLADETWKPLARAAGWPDHRIAIAARPVLNSALDLAEKSVVKRGHEAQKGDAQPTFETRTHEPRCIAIIADTTSVSPEGEFEYSSHKLLWELIAEELANDPFALGDDVEIYLASRMRRLEIADEGLDRPRFIDQLIVPAWQQGLARTLQNARVPLRLFGQGWEAIPDLASCWAGNVTSRHDLASAIASAAGLLHAWPVQVKHPIEATNRPILWAVGRKGAAFLEDARKIFSRAGQPLSHLAIHENAAANVLSWDIIRHLTK